MYKDKFSHFLHSRKEILIRCTLYINILYNTLDFFSVGIIQVVSEISFSTLGLIPHADFCAVDLIWSIFTA